MTIADSASATPEVLLARAEELVPFLREMAPEAERLRQMPPETMAAFERTGLLGATRPLEAGGSAVDLATFMELTRILSRGDASAGWAGSFFMSSNWLMSKLPAAAQEEIFGSNPWVLACGTASRPGMAQKVDGGYRVTGQWGYASGVMHSSWAGLFAISPSEQRMLNVAVPIEDVEVIDVWDMSGMKGTGSNDIAANDVFVPDHRAIPIEVMASPDCPGTALWDYELLRYPMHRVLPLIHPAVALGVADAAVELFKENTARRIRVENQTPALDDPTVQIAYGQARYHLRKASLLMADAIAITEAGYGPSAQRPLELDERAELNLAATGASVEAFAAVDLLLRHSGASVHRAGHPLDRIDRDTQVMRNHPLLDLDYVSLVSGRVLLGRGLGDHPDATF